MKKSFRYCRRLLSLVIALGLLWSLTTSTPTSAQDGPQCPPGFHFDRMSGVGCVQDNCLSISGARYSYTGSCICNDEFKGCYGPINAPDYDSALCFPFCPASQLLSCVSHDAECPSTAPLADQATGEGETLDLPAMSAGVEALLRDLEEYLVGEGHPISAGRSAAAAAAASALLAAWVITNLAAGARLEDLLGAIKAWLGGRQPGPAPAEAGKPALAGGNALPGAGGKPQEAKAPGVKKAVPGKPVLSAAGKPGQTPDPNKGAVPAITPPATPPAPPITPPAAPPLSSAGVAPPAGPGVQDQSNLPVDPAKLRMLEDRFRELVDIAIENDFYVANRSLVEKGWNSSVGGVINYMRGKYGGTCGDFSEWGRQWTKSFAEQIFGPGVVVDEIYIAESSSERAQALIYDPVEWLDSWISANHAATRVILPNGESYILDYWQAVGDRQRGLFEKSADALYNQMFGGKPAYPEARIRSERDWTNQWQPKFDSPSDPASVHNMHYAQAELQKYIDTSKSEAEAFDRYRRASNPGVPPQQIETIINSYKRGGVWWRKL